MTIDVSAQIDAAQRASLPPPRAFGETNTLTLPRRRAGASRGVAAPIVEAAAEAGAAEGMRVSIVAADPGALTLTF